MLIIGALDLATKCGWSAGDDGGVCINSGVFNLARSYDKPGDVFVRFEDILIDWISKFDIDAIAFEQVGFLTSQKQAERYFGLKAILMKVIRQRELLVEWIHVSTLKKYATGSGRAKKDQMIKAAKDKWPEIDIQDDNEADALWILDWAKGKF